MGKDTNIGLGKLVVRIKKEKPTIVAKELYNLLEESPDKKEILAFLTEIESQLLFQKKLRELIKDGLVEVKDGKGAVNYRELKKSPYEISFGKIIYEMESDVGEKFIKMYNALIDLTS